MIATLVLLPVYFVQANRALLDPAFPTRDVAAELAAWWAWNWVRTGLAVLAVALACTAMVIGHRAPPRRDISPLAGEDDRAAPGLGPGRRLVDLSHTIEDGMATYPGLPGPQISDHLTFDASHEHYAEGTEFTIGHVAMIANTGTYLDTPAHRFRDGHDLSGLPLERCADLPAVVIDTAAVIDTDALDALDGIDVTGSAVLLRTGWDRHWGTESYGRPEHPYLTEAGALELIERGVALVGIDSVNIDDTTTGQRPAHTLLLNAGIPIVEHLTNLAEVPGIGARFSAVPPAVRGLSTFPVRAHAAVPGDRADASRRPAAAKRTTPAVDPR